jgi:hypothetical protein
MKFAQCAFKCISKTAFVFFIISCGGNAFAQSAGTQPDGHGISLNFGPLLLKNVPVSNEILSSGSFRYDYPLERGNFIEGGLLMSNSAGAHYQDLAASFRANFPFEDLTLFALGGLDFVRMKPEGGRFTYYGGIHAATGMMAHIFDQTFLRMEMRFNLHPGTILLFGFGVEIHFGGGSGG